MIDRKTLMDLGYEDMLEFYDRLIQARIDNNVDFLLEYMHAMSKKQKKELIDYINNLEGTSQFYLEHENMLFSLKNIAQRAL